MTTTEPPAPDWYPDPYGRHEHRYFDGSQWTEHVSSHGRQSTDAPGGNIHVPTVDRKPKRSRPTWPRLASRPVPSRGAERCSASPSWW